MPGELQQKTDRIAAKARIVIERYALIAWTAGEREPGARYYSFSSEIHRSISRTISERSALARTVSSRVGAKLIAVRR